MAPMHTTIDERKPVRFKQPLTFKALRQQGLCPTWLSSLLLGLAALLVYNTGYVIWNLPAGVRKLFSTVTRARWRKDGKSWDLSLVVQGVAEALAFREAAFDHALIVTKLCFVDDARAMLVEARRVLTPRCQLVIGFIDRASVLGQDYLARQASHVFYRESTFYSAAEVDAMLRDA
jgi:SAM-dependent methyltransferase